MLTISESGFSTSRWAARLAALVAMFFAGAVVALGIPFLMLRLAAGPAGDYGSSEDPGLALASLRAPLVVILGLSAAVAIGIALFVEGSPLRRVPVLADPYERLFDPLELLPFGRAGPL